MAKLLWDEVGKRLYEAGVDRGVLYLADANGVYNQPHSWNGLTAVTESPSGAESNPQYADNIKYLNLLSAEEFSATIEAFTYPDAFNECDGVATPQPGALIGQQGRRIFGMSYRTLLGNDLSGTDFGRKLHMVYGAQASPSEKAYGTINDSPEAITFSWEVASLPVPVVGLKPASQLVVDSTKVTVAKMTTLEDILYGTETDNARLPLPDEVISILGAGITTVNMALAANQPTYNTTTKVVTLPTVTGVDWKINGVDATPGAQPAMVAGETSDVRAIAEVGFNLQGADHWTFAF